MKTLTTFLIFCIIHLSEIVFASEISFSSKCYVNTEIHDQKKVISATNMLSKTAISIWECAKLGDGGSFDKNEYFKCIQNLKLEKYDLIKIISNLSWHNFKNVESFKKTLELSNNRICNLFGTAEKIKNAKVVLYFEFKIDLESKNFDLKFARIPPNVSLLRKISMKANISENKVRLILFSLAGSFLLFLALGSRDETR